MLLCCVEEGSRVVAQEDGPLLDVSISKAVMLLTLLCSLEKHTSPAGPLTSAGGTFLPTALYYYSAACGLKPLNLLSFMATVAFERTLGFFIFLVFQKMLLL